MCAVQSAVCGGFVFLFLCVYLKPCLLLGDIDLSADSLMPEPPQTSLTVEILWKEFFLFCLLCLGRMCVCVFGGVLCVCAHGCMCVYEEQECISRMFIRYVICETLRVHSMHIHMLHSMHNISKHIYLCKGREDGLKIDKPLEINSFVKACFLLFSMLET